MVRWLLPLPVVVLVAMLFGASPAHPSIQPHDCCFQEQCQSPCDFTSQIDAQIAAALQAHRKSSFVDPFDKTKAPTDDPVVAKHKCGCAKDGAKCKCTKDKKCEGSCDCCDKKAADDDCKCGCGSDNCMCEYGRCKCKDKDGNKCTKKDKWCEKHLPSKDAVKVMDYAEGYALAVKEGRHLVVVLGDYTSHDFSLPGCVICYEKHVDGLPKNCIVVSRNLTGRLVFVVALKANAEQAEIMAALEPKKVKAQAQVCVGGG